MGTCKMSLQGQNSQIFLYTLRTSSIITLDKLHSGHRLQSPTQVFLINDNGNLFIYLFNQRTR